MDFANYLNARNHLYTGRASSAIYLALCANEVRGAQVLVPASICYAAVLPIIYSGNQPIFADVGEDGNLTCATVAAVRGGNIKAAIIPHMYGNPCREIDAICKTLHALGAVVIEDCASAMGADIDGVMTGTFGDYAVYSFGHSKTIDCGHGGLIVSQRSLDDLVTLNTELPWYTPRIDTELQLFSQAYRLLRSGTAGVLTEDIYEYLRQRMQHCFLFRAMPEQIAQVSANLSRLVEIICRRRENSNRYEMHLDWGSELKQYIFHKGAVPWRYNLMVDEARKPGLTANLLLHKVAVSDWYPVIAPMFGANEPFPQAQRMERQLLNFPLVDVTAGEIQRIAQVVNKFLRLPAPDAPSI